MTKYVAYKICTCDICGHTVQVAQSVDLPKDWARIKADIYFAFDACPCCAKATLKFLEERKEFLEFFKRENEEE